MATIVAASQYMDPKMEDVPLATQNRVMDSKADGSLSKSSTCDSIQDDSSYSQYKCSAVHTLERDMPDFDYSHLVKQMRQMMLDEYEHNPGIYSWSDIEKCKRDDWFLSRFLLRHKLDMGLGFGMLKAALRYRHESLINGLRAEDFPAEFYQLGGLFPYETDRKGNKMLYMRVKIHKKVPEIQAVLQAFIYHQIKSIDEEADGKGISIVIDCTDGGLANADMDSLLFFFHLLNNYFPKGLSYLLVHELPWILKPFWYIAKSWIPDDKRELIKFSDSRNIYEYVDKENLPDFMGGTCKRDYRQVPENCTSLLQASKLWGVESSIIRKTILKFANDLPEDALEVLDKLDSDEKLPDTNDDSDQENRPN